MRPHLKWIVLVETTLLLLVLGFFVYNYTDYLSLKNKIDPQYEEELLSKELYAGVYQEESFVNVNYAPLKEGLKDYFATNKISAAIYIQDLISAGSMGIDEYSKFNPASLNKLMLAIILMKEVEEGKIKMDQMVVLEKRSSYGDLYQSNLTEIPFQVLFEKMLTESDNTAFFSLVPIMDPNTEELILSYLDLIPETDQKPYTLTPRSILNVYLSLYHSTILTTKNSEYILYLLKNSVPNIREVAGIPKTVRIAHKSGVVYEKEEKEYRDCGIMYYKEDRIFYCIMITNQTKEQSEKIAATVVRYIYDYQKFQNQKLKEFESLCSPNCRKISFDQSNMVN